jgi:hypothetical protein
MKITTPIIWTMFKILNANLDKMEKNLQLKLGSLLCFGGDFLIVFYFSKFLKTFITKDLISFQLKIMGLSAAEIAQFDFTQFSAIIASSAKIMLAIFLAYNAIIYFCCAIGKKWASGYVRNYALTGGLLSICEFYFYIKKSGTINPYTLATIILYALSFYVLHHFKKSQAQET